MKKLNQNGSHLVVLVLITVVLGVVGFAGWRVMNKDKKTSSTQPKESTQQESVEQTANTTERNELIWQQGDGGWRSMQTPPACPDQPMMKMPANIKLVTGILYPGQTRGGNYKPHGGFRFDNSANKEISVTAPIDGFIVRGGSYLAEGEVQYTFDVMNNCGVMYRLGHFRELPENLEALTKDWPEPMENDSRTHQVSPAVYVKQGEVLATSVGIVQDKNTFFDWGVYDYRQENEASKSSDYQTKHAQDKELSWHAVCWFDWLPASDASKVKSLPSGDPGSGKNSDYCK